jgi:eukaryotic-like serine/threonine-protein kinase
MATDDAGQRPADSDGARRLSGTHPERIGPYRILSVLGQGGMGLVYVAEQAEPVRRRVALKVIRAGMDSDEVVARFAAERQALAVMEHPNIAKVLDGGLTGDGRPYFVMELVKGVPITEYCDMNKLRTRARLSLFIEACHAVQHAHQKGVIHRDLKPTNVLVALQDGVPVPKVIDFGIAKALSQSLTDRTLLTEVGQAVGTPAYMSPEQADPSALDVDTRADVYSLGVVLYELLVGRLPLDPSELGYPAFMVRLANRETNVSTPSAKLATLGQAATSVSHSRRTDVRGLSRELSGDLDWIVMKALDPDRSRRYETVNALAMDLQRFLRSEPVIARPPSSLYRLSRFARRNRVAVAAGAAVAVALVAGLTVSAIALVRARQAEAVARREAETSRQVAAFLTGLFRVSDPSEARGNSITAREILDRGAARINTELAAQPQVQAQLMHTMGNVYRELGLFAQAQPLLERAAAIRTELAGADAPDTRTTVVELARLAQQQGRFPVAESLYVQSMGATERAGGRDDPALLPILNGLGGMFITRGRFAEAESLLARAVALRSAMQAPDDNDFARLLRNLAASHLAQGRYADAEPVFRRALVMTERVAGTDHPDVGRTLSNLGVVYYGLERYDEAAQYYERAERVLAKSLGEGHRDLASIHINLGEIEWKRGRLGEAERRLRRALDILARVVEPTHPSVGTAEFDLANILRDAGRGREAEGHYLRALEIRERAFGQEVPAVGEVLVEYAKLLRALGRSADADRAEARARASKPLQP